ncbi:hypothetical protein KHU50_004774 [Colletotrichum sp. SAR 10_65]|nr:hypothetical protein KHU50_004774 [Colletotrichum sp. SAR 10_65]KAI8177812.1 hypothetical protein K4K51_005165 [Colletotrichum sp. SAR 10_75]
MAEKSNQGRKSALLIGINKYSSSAFADLRGCLSDVDATESFLTEVAGISNITKLISPPKVATEHLPTLANIRSKFQDLARGAQPGDFIYIHYSGHGTRRPTVFGGLKGEHENDECLVLASSNDKLEVLRDVEIAFLMKQITDKGARVTFVLDCCHSGGATRGDDDGVRGADGISDEYFLDSNREPIAVENLEDAWCPSHADTGRGGTVVQHWMTASKGINFLAACHPHQKAQEVPRRAGERRGLLTACLASVVNAHSGMADFLPQLSCNVVSNLVTNTLRTHEDRDTWQDQDVVFGGQGDCQFFGAENVVQPAVVVAHVDELPSGKLRLELTAGVAHGVCKRDIFAIYPRGKVFTSLADYTEPLSTCSVTAVKDFTCRADTQLKMNTGDLQDGCVAVSLRSILKDHVLQPKGVRVSAADDSTEPLDLVVQRVRDCIGRESSLVELKDVGDAFFKVLVQKAGRFTIFFTPNQAEAKVDFNGRPEDVLSHLIHLSIFYNLFKLAEKNAAQQGITVRKIGYLDEGVTAPDLRLYLLDGTPYLPAGLNPVPQDSIDILVGQSLGIEVRNASQKSVYFEVLDLEPSWQVTRTYPMEGHLPVLAPPNSVTLFFIMAAPSETVRNAVQPAKFDRPADNGGAPPVLEPINEDDGRAGVGVAPPMWFVQQLDMRVVEDE